MDYSSSESDLAEELKATRVRVQHLEMQVEELSQRIGNIVSQLGKLTKVVREVMSVDVAQQNGSTAPNQAATAADEDSVASSDGAQEIPHELLQAIRLLTEHRSDDAQKLVTSLPRETLADFPGIVAMVAAAVRIRKGEFEVARAALGKARDLIEDQRLVKVIRFLEKQIPA
ncbi:MAG: hypothetical protein H7A35_09540 [Planctomycetales bacterium]|nr:hypothetical protein [bacterium]UNM07120.1 MAG: hypothetical protein H7A35_09540 [Planctomycetales bacterium]